MTSEPQPLLFKPLVDNRAVYGCFRKEGKYPPIGQWTEPIESPKAGFRGYRLVKAHQVLYRWRPRAKLYWAEGEEPMDIDGPYEIVFRRVRLLGEITRDWSYLRLYPTIALFLAATERSLNPDADISWLDIARADRPASIVGACLRYAKLAKIKLHHTQFSGTVFESADLSQSSMDRIIARYCNFLNTNLSGADLRSALLDGSTFMNANLTNANAKGAKFTRANLERAVLRGANLQFADFTGAILAEADLTDAECKFAKWKGANLEGAKWTGEPPEGWEFDEDGLLKRKL